ncbi:MAG TPA: preprotein translocase subunit SecG [Bryobacteraceae bacterium]|nr:preprotein translocase subunit SecG [Bryobacteraceae bacterium]
MLTVFLTIIHVIVSIFLVVVVLLQSGQAADLAGAFGGMGSQTAFGPRGSATLLSKATAVATAIFMVTSMSLAVLATKNAGTGSSVLDQARKTTPAQSAPAKQAPKPIQTTPMPAAPQPSAPPAK